MMIAQRPNRVAVNGCSVIGKRVAEAISLPDDMELVGVCDVEADWHPPATTRMTQKPVLGFHFS